MAALQRQNRQQNLGVLHRVCPRIVRLFLFSGDSPLIEGFVSLAKLRSNLGTDPALTHKWIASKSPRQLGDRPRVIAEVLVRLSLGGISKT